MGRQGNANWWYDLHCHVLPGVDDGCKSSEESVQLLLEDREQGVCGVIATPHYYPQESIMAFLDRRAAAIDRLQNHMQECGAELPQLCFGAEVAYHVGLSCDEDLQKLCLGKSNFLLLELPFSRWPSAVMRDIREINGQGIVPIIAHVERYLGYQTAQTAQELLGANVLIQVNAGALEGWKGRSVRKLLKQGNVDVLASDAHNLTSRPPNLGKVAMRLQTGRMGEMLEQLRRNNQMVFEAAAGQRTETGN